MSKVAIQGDALGTGTFTIASPNSNSDRTLNLPDAAGTIQVSGNPISGTTGSFSGDLSFNSGYGSAAVAYGCRAWVNFDGTGTVAIRASGNVSSITDNGTGDYTVNFTTALPDANYAVTFGAYGLVFANSGSAFPQLDPNTSLATSSFRMFMKFSAAVGGGDITVVTASVFR
jgi:uncharacterized protein (AIM24 family)